MTKQEKQRLERELEVLEAKRLQCGGVIGRPGHKRSTHGKTRLRIIDKRIAEIKELLQSKR